MRAVGPSAAAAYQMDAQLRDLLAGRVWDFFTYEPAAPLVLPGNTQGNTTISIQATAAFLILQSVLTAVQDANPDVIVDPAPLTVRVNTSAGTDFFASATHVNNVFGSGRRPCWWPFYRLCEATTTLTLQFSNLGATDLRLFPAFLGIRVYNLGWNT